MRYTAKVANDVSRHGSSKEQYMIVVSAALNIKKHTQQRRDYVKYCVISETMN